MTEAGPGASPDTPRWLADEQGSLRRVATLVAQESSPAAVFAAVAEEVGRLLTAGSTMVARYDPGGAVPVASWDREHGTAAGGGTVPPDGRDVTTRVYETGRPARAGDEPADRSAAAPAITPGRGARSVVGVPITVDGCRWGVLEVWSPRAAAIPASVQECLAAFAELTAVAVANAATRDKLCRVAEEQEALRRVATLVARGIGPNLVFATVAEEVGALFDSDVTVIVRFEPDGDATVMGGHGFVYVQPGVRATLDRRFAQGPVRETGRAARFDATDAAWESLPEAVRAERVRSTVDVPITVEGRVWGAIGVASRGERLASDTEQRLLEYTDLVAEAIANAEARSQLAESRARLVAVADETRRRIERDLHDGAQQRLVSLALQLRQAQAEFSAELENIATGLTGALDDLREIARGIHPATLAEGGLGPALRSLARRSSVPVELDVRTPARLPEPAEVTAYYIVAEALTNVAKHAHASVAAVTVETVGEVLRVSVRDDGVGGATFAHGTGLPGLKDRVEALGGRLFLDSPPGAGTRLWAELPQGPGPSAAPGTTPPGQATTR
ncbi:GAF domain-containing protein [Dactylosporangium sp. McL0621]|uniref:sensor histidine kinase n=1 Tax=Dactylosporangium sp. McL0621 TaxID=3415678 RepID=UPI003CEB2574